MIKDDKKFEKPYKVGIKLFVALLFVLEAALIFSFGSLFLSTVIAGVGTNVTVISNDKTIREVGGEHEALHILHNERSIPMRELSDYANKIYADDNEKYCELSSLLQAIS